MSQPLVIEYFTDILCIWAWVAQRRVDELNTEFGDQIQFRYHCIDIFGDTATKMDSQWRDRGGFVGYAEHVRHSASIYEEAPVNSKVWTEVRPATSANAHMVLKAIEITHGGQCCIDMALKFRKAFFFDALDIGDLNVICGFVKAQGLDVDKINCSINDGSAMAKLMSDQQKSREQNIKGSPSFVIDGGRQILYGNVGYRVLRANIEEVLRNPTNEASWC